MSSQDSFPLPAGHTANDQQHELQTVAEPTTPHNDDLVHEIRTATSQIADQLSAHLSARLDGINLRLGDVERQYRLQPSPNASPSPSPRSLPSATDNIPAAAPLLSRSAQDNPNEAPPAFVNLQRGSQRVRQDAIIPPHMTRTAAALANPVHAPPSRPAS
ncbi:hypothetical protein A4X09_0g2172 [Tilletia walkeri]|uniref:Uncharacterized protein n=1 Tax=Tilletia walkeri TaxID=117179 RepID=A0A8X7NDR4_9BASI|nr:hypothetical protein A4X09_0g2172 [Tilletia walkeri]